MVLGLSCGTRLGFLAGVAADALVCYHCCMPQWVEVIMESGNWLLG